VDVLPFNKFLMTKFRITSILVVYIHCFEYIPQHIGKAEPVHKTVLYQNVNTGQFAVFGYRVSVFFGDFGGGILLMA
jgi:hypothetical protein